LDRSEDERRKHCFIIKISDQCFQECNINIYSISLRSQLDIDLVMVMMVMIVIVTVTMAMAVMMVVMMMMVVILFLLDGIGTLAQPRRLQNRDLLKSK